MGKESGPKGEMGPARRALDKLAGLNTAVDVVLVPVAYMAVGAVAAGYALVSLMGGMYIRENYIRKPSQPETSSEPKQTHLLARFADIFVAPRTYSKAA